VTDGDEDREIGCANMLSVRVCVCVCVSVPLYPYPIVIHLIIITTGRKYIFVLLLFLMAGTVQTFGQ